MYIYNIHIYRYQKMSRDHQTPSPARWFPPPPLWPGGFPTTTTILHRQCSCSCKFLMPSYREYMESM